MDCSQPGYSIHGILQASILEWVAIPFCQFLSSFFRYFVLFSFFPHIFHSLSFFLFYSFLPMLLFITYFFFILPFYNFSYFSLLLLSLSQSLSFPLSFSFSFLHSFTLLSYFPLSCSITLKKIFLFFPVYYCSLHLPSLFPFPPHLFHFFLCLLKYKKQNIYVQTEDEAD